MYDRRPPGHAPRRHHREEGPVPNFVPPPPPHMHGPGGRCDHYGPAFQPPPPPPPIHRTCRPPFGLRLRRPIRPHELVRLFDSLRRIRAHYPIGEPDRRMLEEIFGRRILPHEVNELTRWLDTEYGIH